MMFTLANVAGLWALAGIPAVLAIHMLQRKAQPVRTTTRFLLDRLVPESAAGRRIERLRGSAEMWLQLLAVALVAWILSDPRWVRPESRQTVAVVLDSSVRMEAAKERLVSELERALRPLAGTAAATEWVLLESDVSRPRLYTGGALADLLAAVPGWSPRLGSHDPSGALRLARSIAGPGGAAIFVTDREAEVPAGVAWLGVGSRLNNVGWIGLDARSDGWTALVRNHGDAPVSTTWHAEVGDSPGPAFPIELGPGETRSLAGPFPEGGDRVVLVLEADGFPPDDRLPVVRPLAKPLRVSWSDEAKLAGFFGRFVASLPDASRGGGGADLSLVEHDLLAPAGAGGNAVVFVTDPAPAERYVGGMVVSEDDPLVGGLSWQGLLVRDTYALAGSEGDRVLVWAGGRPLIFLRGPRGARELVVNFDVRQSNAERIPAFVVLLARFAESVRREIPGFERRNFELNQAVDVPPGPGGEPPEFAGADTTASPRAPARPGFFSATSGGASALEAAAHFADARQADFSGARSGSTLGAAETRLAEANSDAGAGRAFWLLALALAAFGSWHAAGRRGGGAAS